MRQYLDILNHVLSRGVATQNRTGVKALSCFGLRAEYDLSDGFPLVTTKKMFFSGIVRELLWFVSGSTNIRPLVENGVNIWNEWPFAKFAKSPEYAGQSIEWFRRAIIADEAFARKWGDLGPVYGKQWRDFSGVDQLREVMELIKTDPLSRRLVVSAWNPSEMGEMALPPCHVLFQFRVLGGALHCQLYQRSADLFLGVPFNVASYALLTMLAAQAAGLGCGRFVHVMGDAHIYENHLEQVRLQLSREPKPLPRVALNPKVKDLFAFGFGDIALENYECWPKIAGAVAV